MSSDDPRQPIRRRWFTGQFLSFTVILVLVVIVAVMRGDREGYIISGIGATLWLAAGLLFLKARRDGDL